MGELYFGGHILTMEDGPAPQAVAIANGKIVFTGTLQTAKKQFSDFLPRDLHGHTLMPAFIDTHSHITALASTLRLVPLQDARSFDDIVQMLKAHDTQEEWIIGFGYDHNLLVEGMHPDKTVLDAVSADRPVMITHASGHMGVLNSVALRRLDVEGQQSDISGEKIARMDDGTLSGYLEENAFMKYAAAVPQPDAERMSALLQQAQQIYFRYGITTIQDGLTKRPEFDMLVFADEKGLLQADVIGYADMQQVPELLYARKTPGRFRMGGYKIFLDGSPQSKTAWLTAPYEGGGDCGYPVHTDTQVRAFVRQARQEGVQLLAHCNGDAAAQQLIDAFDGDFDANRPVMIHAQTVRPEQLEQMRQIGMIPSFFIAHIYHWGDVHLRNLGMHRAQRISPAGSAQRLGLPYTFHQDTPVLPPDMLQTVWCAVHRRTRDGVLLGAGERITPRQALEAVTRHAAYQYFEEDQKGTIRTGKLADLVELRDNPLDCADLRQIRIIKTIRRGEVLFEAGEE